MTRITIEIPTAQTTDALVRFAHHLGERAGAEVKCHLTITAAPAVAGEILKGLHRAGLTVTTPTYISTSDEPHEERTA